MEQLDKESLKKLMVLDERYNYLCSRMSDKTVNVIKRRFNFKELRALAFVLRGYSGKHGYEFTAVFNRKQIESFREELLIEMAEHDGVTLNKGQSRLVASILGSDYTQG